MVRATGLEPARGAHWILNPARLPIPPRPHVFYFPIVSYLYDVCQELVF